MTVDELVRKPGTWLTGVNSDTGPVVSCRIRLARNLAGHRFPSRADRAERLAVWARVRGVLREIIAADEFVFFQMNDLEDVDKEVLQERQLISFELSGMGEGSAIVLAEDEKTAIMVNEEDHLRLQALSPGMNLEEAWQRVDRLDNLLAARLDYAFSLQLGYLTACPTNVGTGLRTSVMMHLTGLKLTNEIQPVIKGLHRLGLAVRGVQGEGSEAHGNMFQISNQTTLGESEQEIMNRLAGVVKEVATHEENARARLLEGRGSFVLDQVARAYGILVNARMLPSNEAMNLLSILRLGAELGVVQSLSVSSINEIMLLTQRGHLQKMSKKKLGPEERDEVRARIVRTHLKSVRISDTI